MDDVPAVNDIVYVGPPPPWDTSSRLAFYDEDEFEKYRHLNANVQFRVRDKHLVAAWIERFRKMGLAYIDFEGEAAANVSALFPSLVHGFSMFGKRSGSRIYEGPPCKLSYIWLDDGPVFFSRDDFPSLRFLTARPDKDGKLRAFVHGNPSLEHLGIKGYDEQVLNDCAAVRSIQIANARIDDITISSVNANVTRAWLHNLPALSRIAFLEKWPSLEQLKIFYCSKVVDLKPLLALPKLKELQITTAKPQADLSVLVELRKCGVEMSGVDPAHA